MRTRPMEPQYPNGPHGGITSVSAGGTETNAPITLDDLARLRRQLLRILDQLDGRVSNSGPGLRVARLQDASRVPRPIAALMKVILEVRNASESEAFAP